MSKPLHNDLDWKIVTINRKRRRFMDERLSDHGLVGPMYLFLICIDKNPGINQDFLVNFLYIDKGAVAHLAKRLEKLELIKREISPNDRRAYQLALTDKGQEILPIIYEHLNEWSESLLAGVNEQDRLLANELLQRMVDNTV